MKLPKKVKILGRVFKVEYFDFNKKITANNINGNSDGNKQLIQIDNTLHREHQESTLLHELIHLISDSQNLDMNEHSVCLLETGIYQVLTDNGFLRDR